MIVFGGLKGLEASVEADSKIGTDDPSEIFQHYVNVLPAQGSRTIRTEVRLCSHTGLSRNSFVTTFCRITNRGPTVCELIYFQNFREFSVFISFLMVYG